MIYLKEYKEHSLYQKISEEEYYISRRSKDGNITPYLNQISRRLLEIKRQNILYPSYEINVDITKTYKSDFNNLIIVEFKDVFYINMSIRVDEDEWFYVKLVDEIASEDDEPIDYYKCDQLDGLFQLIKDKIF